MSYSDDTIAWMGYGMGPTMDDLSRSVKERLEPYKVTVGPATCPKCGKLARVFVRLADDLVCRECRDRH
jgi:uncharacterized protein (UPF0212 family)